MLVTLGQADWNYRNAVNLYAETFDDGRRLPDHRVFINLHNRLLRGEGLVPGLFMPPRQGRRIFGVDAELEFLVLRQFEENPNLSTRVCAIRLGLDKNQNRLVHRILKSHGMYPYKYQKVQALLLGDYQRRIAFCNLMHHRINQEPNFLQRILWTDECTFTPNGMFNNKNFVEWRDENPFNVRATKHQHRWSINIWAGIIGDRLVKYCHFNSQSNVV